jgi:hypothetical protein
MCCSAEIILNYENNIHFEEYGTQVNENKRKIIYLI